MVALLAGAAGLTAWWGRVQERPPPPPPDAGTIEGWTQQARAVLRAAAELKALPARRYLPGSALEAWRRQYLQDHQPLSAEALRHLPDDLRRLYQQAEERIARAEEARAAHNEAFVRHQLGRMSDWFDAVLSRPLTPAQRRAVVVNEDNNLIVAGAGTGKTTTIEARALYLVQQQLARPSDILILSFNRSVADEIRERLEQRGLSIDVETFHSMGLKILSEVEGRKPAISPLAESAFERQSM